MSKKAEEIMNDVQEAVENTVDQVTDVANEIADEVKPKKDSLWKKTKKYVVPAIAFIAGVAVKTGFDVIFRGEISVGEPAADNVVNMPAPVVKVDKAI